MQYAKPKVYWLMLIGIIFSILNISTSYAAVTCPTGMIADTFQTTDYASLAPNTNPATPTKNQSIVGVKDESYLVVSNYLTQTGQIKGKDLYRPITLTSQTGPSQTAFEFFQDFQTPISTRTITYDFTNRFTGTAQPVEKFSLTIYDIDSNYVGGQTGYIEYEYVDQLTIVGKTASGATVNPTVTSKGTNITANSPFSQTARQSSVACDNTVMDSKCQLSVTFSQPVVQVTLTYGNVANLNYYDIADDNGDGIKIGDPGDQLVNIVFDGYCYTPQPRLSLTKVLADNRIADTNQFIVQIKDKATSAVVNSTTNSTTTGTTNVVTTGTGTTGTYKIDPTKSYILTEAASGNTDLSKYQATYECKKKSDSSTITTLDPNNVKMTYGDDWVCTVRNAQKKYTFSGIVFNDNGGLTLTERQLTGTNTQYFNGVYDPTAGETGISQTGLTINLAKNCNTATPTVIKTANVTTLGADIGKYIITATQTEMAGATNVCLIEQEPGNNLTTYPVDTTNNQINVNYVATTSNYPNLNFGEVSQNNAGLVLLKGQAVTDCNITNAAMLGLTYNAVTQSGIDARKCVAYKITAHNRTNLTNPLTNVRITDALPKKGVNTSTVTSALVGPTDTTSANFNINFNSGVAGAVTDLGQTGTVVSNLKSLAAGANMSLYFNTKYDSSLP